MNIQQVVADHGAWTYLITFVWTFFEGETFVLFAGFAAANGLLSWPILLVCAWFGSFGGDQVYFWVGRQYGTRLLAKRPAWRGGVDKALDALKKYDTAFILSFRFIYGIRNFSSFAMGISGIGWKRFMVLNFIAAGLWASSFVAVGYLCGHLFERMMGELAHDFGLGMLAVFLVGGGGIVIYQKWKRRRRAAAAAMALPPSG